MRRTTLLIALFLLAVSGLMLHYRIHNFMVPHKFYPGTLVFDKTRFLASLLPFIDVIGVTALFAYRRTAVYGYLLNGMLVIYGTVLMTHYSIAEMAAKAIPLHQMFLRSTLPDIGIAWADFLVGKTLYEMTVRE